MVLWRVPLLGWWGRTSQEDPVFGAVWPELPRRVGFPWAVWPEPPRRVRFPGPWCRNFPAGPWGHNLPGGSDSLGPGPWGRSLSGGSVGSVMGPEASQEEGPAPWAVWWRWGGCGFMKAQLLAGIFRSFGSVGPWGSQISGPVLRVRSGIRNQGCSSEAQGGT